MTYSNDELFDIVSGKYDGEAFVWDFLKGGDPAVTSVEVPSEYEGYPVTSLHRFCFSDCVYLTEVVLPDSITQIDSWAFAGCGALRSVRLPKSAEIRPGAFDGCPLLAPEVVMAGLIGRTDDITAPFNTEDWADETWLFSAEDKLNWESLLRPDVFRLVLKYDSFRELGIKRLLKEIKNRGLVRQFVMLVRAGGYELDAPLTELLIGKCAENGFAEETAWLLEFKNHRFGFEKKDDYDLL